MNGVEEKQFAFSYWYVNHREQLKRALVIFLIAVDFILAAFIIYSLIDNLVLNYRNYIQLQASFINDPINMDEIINKSLPKNLTINSLKVFPTAATKGDILASITNPNAKWGAEFSYWFILGDNKSLPRRGYIFPGETKYLIDLAVENGTAANNIQFADIKWIRQNNFTPFFNERINFQVADVNFLPPEALNIPGKLPISRVTFNVTNLSAYNYLDPAFLVLLYRGGDIAGINYITTNEIRSGQKLDLEVSWFENLGAINRVEIIPEVNILDPNVFLKN